MICRSYITSELSIDSDFCCILRRSGIPQMQGKKATFTEIQLSLESSLPCPLQRDMMQTLVTARRKIQMALGSFRGLKPVKSHLGSGRLQSLMNRLNRTSSAKAWKAAFLSSPPKTKIVTFRSEWDCCRLC